MKKFIASILPVIILFNGLTVLGEEQTQRRTVEIYGRIHPLESEGFEWAEEEVIALHRIMIRYGPSSLPSPIVFNREIDRASFVVQVVRFIDYGRQWATSSFNDVYSHQFFDMYVGIAERIGLVTGDENNNFRPDEIITRQDAIVILSKLQALGIIRGDTEGNFRPNDIVHLAEASIFMYRTANLLELISTN